MKKIFNSFILVCMILAFTACSGANGPHTTYDVLTTEFLFSPSKFIVPAGQEITLNITNNGAVVHDFVIFKLGTDAGDHFNEEDRPNVYWDVEVQPGESITTTFTAPTVPGEYSVTCGIQGHLEAGMSAELTVVAEE
ncbi:MAG: cupredoxin domain-containing protein [Anaerolineales bacterium]|nr:cupredoxin domain-containing protein [Anaerolineales bacterium]